MATYVYNPCYTAEANRRFALEAHTKAGPAIFDLARGLTYYPTGATAARGEFPREPEQDWHRQRNIEHYQMLAAAKQEAARAVAEFRKQQAATL